MCSVIHCVQIRELWLHVTSNKNAIFLCSWPDSEFDSDEPCDGAIPLVDEATGHDYDCSSGMDMCPSGSYCHITPNFAKCCKEGKIRLAQHWEYVCMYESRWLDIFFFSFWVQKLCHMYFSNEKKKITTFQNVFIVQNCVIMLLVTFKLHQGKGSLTWDTLITSLVMLICKHGFFFLLFQNFASGCRTS